MKKLIFATLGLIALLLVSIVAKNANFNLRSMMTSGISLPSASSSAQPKITTPTSFPVEIYITLTPTGFVPSALMISPSTKITWINKSGMATSLIPTTRLDDFPTGDFGNNSIISFTFSKSGRYNYHNKKDPTQTGVIIVQE